MDKYLAFHKLLEQLQSPGRDFQSGGVTSTQLLTVLGIEDAGNNCRIFTSGCSA